MTCFIEVSAFKFSTQYSLHHPTPLSFSVLLIKSRVKNKNKFLKKSIGIVKDSDLSWSECISSRLGKS